MKMSEWWNTEWWNTVDTLARIATWTQVSIVVFGLLTAAATALTIVVSNRMSNLRAGESVALQQRLEATERSSAAVGEELKLTTEKLIQAEQRIQSVTAEAAKARASAEESRRKLEPRVITGEQRATLIDWLKQGPSGKVDIAAVLGDPESISFAGELDGVLRGAGWATDGVSQAVYAPSGPVGILLKVRSKDSPPPRALTLQRAFAAIGMEAPGVLDAGVAADYVGLVVGHKHK